MKRLTVLLLITIMALSGCKSNKVAVQEKKAENLEFEYSALTRGSYKKITIDRDGIATVKELNGKVDLQPINAKDWNWLVAYYEDNIDGKVRLQDLEAPSKKHQYDGALAAVFSVKGNDQTNRTPTFDHGAPPAEIAGIVNKMLSLAGIDKGKVEE
jgi:hypothetical protein